MNLNSLKSQIQLELEKLNKRDLIIFLIPFIIFSIYLAIYNPGILTIDSFNQLHQIATGQYTTWHPFFHTFIEMLCLKIYASPLSVGILQILVFSTMWMIICKYLRDDSQKSDLYTIQVIFTAIISLIPINAIYAITLWKDVLFSYNILFLCFLIKVMTDRKGKVDYKFIIVMAIIMAFIAGLRHNGIYVVVVSLIAAIIYLYKKNPTEKMHLVLPALAVVFILLITSLNVAYDVEDTQRDALFVKNAHMLADYDLHLDMDDADRNKLYEMINESQINTSYNIYYADPISWISNQQVYDSNAGDYLSMAFKYSIQNPMRALFYIFKSSDIVWDVTRDADWTGQPYYITGDSANVEKAKNQYFTSINATPSESYEDVTDTNAGSGVYKLLTAFVNAARGDLVLGTLFNSPALYMYLAILLMILISVATKSREIYLIYLPNLANIIIIFASTPVQDNRFLYANLLVCYLIILIAAGIFIKHKDSPAQTQNESEEVIPKMSKLSQKSQQNLKPSQEIGRPPQRQKTPEEMEAEIRAKIMREMEMEAQIRAKVMREMEAEKRSRFRRK